MIGSTYLDPMKPISDVSDRFKEITKEWVDNYEKTFMGVLEAIANDEQIKAQQIFLEGLNKFTAIVEEGTDKLCHVASDALIEGYQVGYSEGAYDAEQEVIKQVNQLIAEGSMNSLDDLIRFLTVVKVASNKNFDDHMKGRRLLVDKSTLFNYNKGNDNKGGKDENFSKKEQ